MKIKYIIQKNAQNNLWADIYEYEDLDKAIATKKYLQEDVTWNTYRIVKRETIETVIE